MYFERCKFTGRWQKPGFMTDYLSDKDMGAAVAEGSSAWRPILFFACVGFTMAALLWLAITALSAGGFGALDLILVALFAVTLPWYVIGFWNAVIGLAVMRFARDPISAVMPAAGRVRGNEPILASTAILLCIRNEPPDRVARLIEPMLAGLANSGFAGRFHLYILSDTDIADVATAEERRFAGIAACWRGRMGVTYRRRSENSGYKAGNIADFCARWGKQHDFGITLDADSVLGIDLLLTLVRIMQVDPQLGIVQSLVVGMPSASAFARIFQFGMRLGMRSYTIGSAWWQGDCGPYWGHNAIVRLAPFIECCRLPILKEGALVKGHVLSHDQIEAVLMQKSGYAVRAFPQEGSSFEQNPPTLVEFIRRDLRWCQGNMQYWHFLTSPGLRPIGRYQLFLAILMFLASPAWMGLLLIGTLGVLLAPAPADFMHWRPGITLLLLVLAMWFAPNLATLADVLIRPHLRRLFGGAVRFTASFAITVVFVILIAPIMWASHTLFLIRLFCGRTVPWTVQTRDDHSVPWSLALRQFWAQTSMGLVPVVVLAATVPRALPFALLIAAGPLLSIPLAVSTASPAVGRALIALGLDRLPEEGMPPPELRALELPAIEMSARALTLGEAWHSLRGVVRSLRIYYGDRTRRAAMDRLYRQFIKPGDLAFDIGAHVGDRVAAFRRIGARVVAVEPQPALARTLKLLYGRDREVVIEESAIARRPGTLPLTLNLDNPTVSSASEAFVEAANGFPGWTEQRWSRTIRVPATTLDALIERHGRPAFIKIDVEGFEAEALAGLTHPVPVLSFEFTTIAPNVAAASIARCEELGYVRFNAAVGESHTLVHAEWLDAGQMRSWLSSLPTGTNSGDVYAARDLPLQNSRQ
jgi:membrane glycosyltransferase